MSDQLPKLIDRRGIQEELGVKHTTADAIMRRLPKVQIPGVRKLYVKRADVERFIREHEAA